MDKKLKNKVMIVDDDETIILPIEMSIQEKGIDTISFNDGEEALKYLKNNKVSVILLDYHMEPNINGDEFIRRLREFDKETIVYLQTAYSEELPAMDMLEKYEIQGYIDKGKRDFERMQLIISALKQAQILELVKEQEKQLDAKDYQNEFLGKFLNRLVGEMSERSMAMAGSIMLLEEMKDGVSEKELFERSVESIKNSMTRLNKLIKSLEIKEEDGLVKDLKDILNTLFEMTFIVKDVRFTLKTDNEYKLINCNVRVLTYILVDIIEYLISQNEKDINFEIEENVIKICNKIEDEAVYNKINKLAMLDEKIDIVNEFNQLKISI